MAFRDRFFTPQTAKALLSWRILLAARDRRGRRRCSGWSRAPAIGLGLAVYAATVLAAMPRVADAVDDRPVHPQRAVAPVRAERPTVAQRPPRDGPRAADGPLKDRLADIAEPPRRCHRGELGDRQARRRDRRRDQAHRPGAVALPARHAASVRRRRRRRDRSRRVGGEPAGQRRTAEGAVGEHRRPPAAHPGAARRARRPGRRGQRRRTDDGDLRARRRQPRDRARRAAPGRRRDERAHVEGRRVAPLPWPSCWWSAPSSSVATSSRATTDDRRPSTDRARRARVHHRARRRCATPSPPATPSVTRHGRGCRRHARPARRPRSDDEALRCG